MLFGTLNQLPCGLWVLGVALTLDVCLVGIYGAKLCMELHKTHYSSYGRGIKQNIDSLSYCETLKWKTDLILL